MICKRHVDWGECGSSISTSELSSWSELFSSLSEVLSEHLWIFAGDGWHSSFSFSSPDRDVSGSSFDLIDPSSSLLFDTPSWDCNICVAVTSFFNSSRSLFSFARRFWNHVITCAFVKPKFCAISSLSAGVRYFWYRKRFSSSYICWLVKAVLDFLRFFGGWCFPNKAACSLLLASEIKRTKI